METWARSREACFDRLVEEATANGDHDADDPDRLGLTPPEWSHLDAKPAATFTASSLDIVEGMVGTPLR